MKKIKLKLYITASIILLFSSIAISYALGTWNTGYRAIDGADTSVDTNHGNPLDEFIVDNDHGYDLFVPTKTFGELKSMWDFTPVNVEMITGKESFSNLTDDPAISAYHPVGEDGCDGTLYPETYTFGDYISHRRYQILKIDVPSDIEAYLNIRGEYDGDQANENLYIFKQAEGGSPVTATRLHELYNDGSTTGWNPPIYDFDADGTDDIELHYIADPHDDGSSSPVWVTVKTTTKIKFFAGTNYLRLQTGDGSITGNHHCESGDYSNVTSIHYDSESSPQDLVWLSNK